MNRSVRGRRSIRLAGYDYRSAGAYFLTICTHRRALTFRDEGYADIALQEWQRSAEVRREIELDAFVVMPNHVHGIVVIAESVGAQGLAPPGAHPTSVAPRSLGSFVRGYKSAVTTAINEARGTPRQQVWQRNYYEHVVRDEAELDRIRRYIEDNPRRWEFDPENPLGRPDRAEIEFWERVR